MPAVADLGTLAPTATVRVTFVTVSPWLGLESWSGLAFLVNPDRRASEAGVASDFNDPIDGEHAFVIDLPRAEGLEGPGFVVPGRYFVVAYGDPILQEPVQGVPVATFVVK